MTTPKPKKPTMRERIQQNMDESTTPQLLEQLQQVQNPSLIHLMEAARSQNAPTLAEHFRNDKTGGLTLFGSELPDFDEFNDVRLDESVLGSSVKRYQQSRKAIATAVEQFQRTEESAHREITRRVNGIIRKKKGGKNMVRNYQRHLKVQDLEILGSEFDYDNKIEFTSSGTFITVKAKLPIQRFDVSDVLSLLTDWDDLAAVRFLQTQITQHVSLLNNHVALLSMATGVSAHPDDGGVNIHRIMTCTARLWHGPDGAIPSQWSLSQVATGKLNRKHEEVRNFTELNHSEYTFEGAAENVLVLELEVGYRIKVRRTDLDSVLDSLLAMQDAGTEMPIYVGAEAGHTLEQHYYELGVGDIDLEDLSGGEEDEAPTEEAQPQQDELDMVANGYVEPATETVAEPVVEPTAEAAATPEELTPEPVVEAEPVAPQETATPQPEVIETTLELPEDEAETVLF